ncbi:TetR/AcrR family transcriptional regulator [Brucella pseudogrignonensis]|uniref:AcrR family transcriptional regulator n=1 Tax=Brucella pseudogrignonensis TaxID=419475 RepID=A0ABU1MDR6_9HYPH|nr:TetR/AcrR family transcriptional regulator [Brucella pseudogrignonensis]MDR6433791.1 AcrR family transcriptional regulator [Brucella pseudogrignonensis]
MSNDIATSSKTARERLLETAAILFYNDGIAATGIDTITRRAGVAKQSLYNNFSSKADLVATYLELRHNEWLTLYNKRLESKTQPKEKILAVFKAYEDHAEFAYEHGFRGCGLLNAAAELSASDPGRATVRKHKEQIEDFIEDHLRALLTNEEQIKIMARHLSFILEGAITRAGLEGNGRQMREAQDLVLTILKNL